MIDLFLLDSKRMECVHIGQWQPLLNRSRMFGSEEICCNKLEDWLSGAESLGDIRLGGDDDAIDYECVGLMPEVESATN